MVRFIALLLVIICPLAAFAEEGPRVEIIRNFGLSSFGPFSLTEGRDGAFLLLEAGPAGPAVRVQRLTPSGRKRRLRSIEAGTYFTGNPPMLVPTENGEWVGNSWRGLIGLDDDYRILLARNDVPEAARRLLVPDGRALVPANPSHRPHRQFLAYHRANIFKG